MSNSENLFVGITNTGVDDLKFVKSAFACYGICTGRGEGENYLKVDLQVSQTIPFYDGLCIKILFPEEQIPSGYDEDDYLYLDINEMPKKICRDTDPYYKIGKGVYEFILINDSWEIVNPID